MNKLWLPFQRKKQIVPPQVGLAVKVGQLSPDKEIVEQGEIYAMLDMTVREGIFDPQGKITFDRTKKAESFNTIFMWMLYMKMGGMRNNAYIADITNTVYTQDDGVTTFNANAGVGVVNWGIIVGTGSTAPTISDYVMETPIAHGTGAGQLQYSAMTFGAPASDASTSQFTLTRNFANASGGSITVEEIGLYVKMTSTTRGVLYYMVLRDVTGGIAVPNGQTLTINYRPQASI